MSSVSGSSALQLAPPVAGPGPGTPRMPSNLALAGLVEAVEVAHATAASAATSSPMSSRCSISIPNGRPQSPMWFSRMTSCPSEHEHPHQRVADHRRPQVADVHLLGDVGRRVVDDDRARSTPRPARRADRRARSRPSSRGEEVVVEREVDETRAGDLDRAAHTFEHARVDDLAGRPRAGSARAAWRARAPRSPGRRRDRTAARPDRRRRARRSRRTPGRAASATMTRGSAMADHSGPTAADPTAPIASGLYISGAWTPSSNGTRSLLI